MDNRDKMTDEIKQLFDLSTQQRISNSLRIVLLDYLILHDDYPVNIKEILTDFNIMFDLLHLLSKLDATNSDGSPH